MPNFVCVKLPTERGDIHSDILQYPAELALESPTVSPSSNFETLVVLFPGNPGIIELYSKFCEQIHQDIGEKTAVVGICHAGHSSHNMNGGRVFDLQDQVEHKVAFIRMLRDRHPSANFVLVGHSVGGYILTQVLKRCPDLPLRRAVYLAPTIQHIADYRGPVEYAIKPVFRNVAAGALGALGYLPMAAKRMLCRHLGPAAEHIQTAIPHYLSYRLLLNTLYMARREFDEIKELEHDVISRTLDRSTFYFVHPDEWVPMRHYQDIKDRFPDADVHLDESGTEHAFVIDHSHVVAKKVVAFLSAASARTDSTQPAVSPVSQ